jgi:RNA polymerase sigma-70 factor, ECF subfamily
MFVVSEVLVGNLLRVAEDRRGSYERCSLDRLDTADVACCLEGEPNAYRRIVERYQERVGRMMWRFTRDPVIHQELVQDVFVETYLSLKGFRHRSPFEHWLSRIATRVGYKYWMMREREKESRMVSIEDFPNLTSTDLNEGKEERTTHQVHTLLGQLPPRDRLVLTLRYMEECSVEETARRTGWSQTLVKVQTWRARNKLRRLIEELGEDFER